MTEQSPIDNPWLTRRVLHYAHQGGAREAPSSTLHAMRRAIKLGAQALELDVHRTADGVLVVCHDETVDRTTPMSGSISNLTWEQLRGLDNAYWWVPGHESLHDANDDAYILRGRYPVDDSLGIVTLDAVLSEFTDVFLNFDIKETAPNVVAYEHDLADALRSHGRATDVIVASFHDTALETFRRYAPEIHTSLGPVETLAAAQEFWDGRPISTFPGNQVAVQIPLEFSGERVVTPELVHAVHMAGLAVHVWTIDDPDDMMYLLNCGVDGIMTDCPSILADVLKRA